MLKLVITLSASDLSTQNDDNHSKITVVIVLLVLSILSVWFAVSDKKQKKNS